MNWQANRRLWERLVDVHGWLTKDFLYKVNHAATITAEDWQPFFAAHNTLKAEQFHLDAELFVLSRKLLEESLYGQLGRFIETTNRQIQARDAGDSALQARLLQQMNAQYNQLVRDYAAELTVIKQVVEARFKAQPQVIENFIAGDVVFGDQISVGDIFDSTGIAVGKAITQAINEVQPPPSDETQARAE